MKEPDFTFAHRDEGFDNHIEHSIRGYNELHNDIVNLSRYFVEDNKTVVDIGCSTGKTIHAMMRQNHTFAPNANYIGVEYASGFVKDMSNRSDEIKKEGIGGALFLNEDIRNFKFENCSLITSIFTLQFMPPSSRRDVLKQIYNGLESGGAFIFSEKTMARCARIQEILTFTYYDYKRKNFTDSDILDKERELRHMLKPNTWNDLHSMLMTAGFDPHKINPFWQNHLFIGAIAIK
jgi:tRNA (cmo5U34)-methyltransferase